MEIEGAGIIVGRFFICGGGKSVKIACVFLYTEKWDFIVDIDFLCEIKNAVILKGLLYYVNFISALREKEYVISIP